MASTGQDFTLYQNTALNVAFTVSGIDVTTAGAIVWVMSSYGTAAITKTLAASQIAQTSSTVATVTINASDTASLEVGTYTHQLWITNASSKPTVVAEGVVTLKRDYRS